MAETLQLLDEWLFQEGDLAQRDDGRHLLAEVEGVSVYGEIKDGKVVGWSAEADGEPVENFTLTMTPGGGEQEQISVVCYHCMCRVDTGVCSCRRINC